MSQSIMPTASECCGSLFFAYRVNGRAPLIVLECCRCGRLWRRQEQGKLIPYDRKLASVTASGELVCIKE